MAKNLFPSPCTAWTPGIYLSQLSLTLCKWRDILRLGLEDHPELGLNRITGVIFSGPGGKYAVSKRVPITPIPLSALYSKNIPNLHPVSL